jgi:hypothetical protein
MTAQPSLPMVLGAATRPKLAATLDHWVSGRFNPSRERGRIRARAAMVEAVDGYLATHVEVDAKELLAVVDAAYPFGERRYHPYKMWLAERKILRAILFPPAELELPTLDHAACLVATDLIEEGRTDEAIALLEDQAPRRLNRPCRECAAEVGKPCVDVDLAKYESIMSKFRSSTGAAWERVRREARREASTERIVPHAARTQP